MTPSSSPVRATDLSSRPKSWYPGLDGVRAVAVFLVFTVHYLGRPTHYIGWSGVLIFFVLSGFLITGILFDNQHESHRFRNFYARRTLRIFPLFYFVWLCIFVAGPFLHAQWHPILFLWPTYLGNYARFIGGLHADRIYTSFPRFSLEIGHFWSLAVEEQFYLLWPLVVFFVRGRRALIRICIAVIVAVPFLRLALVVAMPPHILANEFLYRMTFSQVDGFLFGGLLALLMRGPEEAAVLRSAPALLWGAIAALGLSSVLNQGIHVQAVVPSQPWMSIYGFTLLNIAAGGLILSSLQPRTLVFRVMTLWPLRVLGKYSYGFYVYHVLLAPFLSYVMPAIDISRPKRVVYAHMILGWTIDFLAVLAVSAASYHWIEAPFLRLKGRFATAHKNPDAQEPYPSVLASI